MNTDRCTWPSRNAGQARAAARPGLSRYATGTHAAAGCLPRSFVASSRIQASPVWSISAWQISVFGASFSSRSTDHARGFPKVSVVARTMLPKIAAAQSQSSARVAWVGPPLDTRFAGGPWSRSLSRSRRTACPLLEPGGKRTGRLVPRLSKVAEARPQFGRASAVRACQIAPGPAGSGRRARAGSRRCARERPRSGQRPRSPRIAKRRPSRAVTQRALWARGWG